MEQTLEDFEKEKGTKASYNLSYIAKRQEEIEKKKMTYAGIE